LWFIFEIYIKVKHKIRKCIPIAYNLDILISQKSIVNFAFASTTSSKLICYTGTWTNLSKISDIGYSNVSYGKEPDTYREAKRLIEMMEDIEEFKSTNFVYIDGNI
jgi:hypothetical protein